MRKMLKNQKGLTLIELLAVIVILGIIAAIAVPSIGNIISKTEEKAKVAEAIQIINAAKLDRAANPSRAVWSHNGNQPTDGNFGESDTNYNELSSYLEKVSDTTYEVRYNSGNFEIRLHDANDVVKDGFTNSATETELINYTR
ncbi:hypothetical protein BKP37_18750 [Anaerobacillus alkalilacustris]|uniref:Prepilin-type N-terminal cleavage/methylation domain-containing protein n=1 Tax=Anaerobacillus alkalilacustris TaxID=393763 RepID=A0A1S2LDV9_9BACI|nr:type II secretion system protein [Anaerobacillus alkalilacustris]OIJ10571.1 hypothetical protein BKP37_18750 [Anaerobacillus alkalilacustris]